MMTPIEIGIEGIGIWSDRLPGWQDSCALLATNDRNIHVDNIAKFGSRPAPSALAATERRRAPDSALFAVEAAQQACTMAGREPSELPNVFASAYGDLAINDYLCATLADAPLTVSPTRFHNSVHNAPAGYWTIATSCMASSTAITAGMATYGAGLLESIVLARSESCAVLFVAYDIAAVGPLKNVIRCDSAFASALVLAPKSSRTIAQLRIHVQADATKLAPDADLLQALYPDNPAACGMPLLRSLARREQRSLTVAAGPELNLHMEILL
jgi:beta-ketoacyl synthase-like protein